MFDFLKNFFGKPVEQDNGQEHDFSPSENGAPPPPRPGAVPSRYRAALSNPRSGNGGGIQVPLQAVLNTLPLELKTRVRHSDVGDAVLSVSLEKVLSQLSTGAVRTTFGELRRAAPQVFSTEHDRDHVQVPLPLNEILARINPALLVRRQNQKHVEVPDEVSGPFADRGQALIFSVGPSKSEAPIAPPPRAATPATPIQSPPAAPSIPVPPPSAPARVAPFQVPPKPPAFHQSKAAPQTPPTPIPFRTAFNVTQSPPPPPAPVNNPTVDSASVHAPLASSRVPATTPPSAPFARENVSLHTALAAVAENWPEALRQEIVELNLVDAKISLPVDIVGEALKRGRVAFPWKTLRSWIKPTPLPTVSAHDSVPVDLPLKVIAPLFLEHQKQSSKPQHKTEIDETIPNLFFGFPQPSAPDSEAPLGTESRAVAKPVDTNYYVWDDAGESAKVDETEFKRRPSPGTTFVNRYATPNEVVSRAAAIDGVAGVLIALPDGLMVASRISPDLNGDTLAAFLPQIFGKVSACTKELRMGELNNLNFTVGNVPWKIFRVNAIYFAAFGRAGQPLPSAQLAALAAELDRKKN